MRPTGRRRAIGYSGRLVEVALGGHCGCSLIGRGCHVRAMTYFRWQNVADFIVLVVSIYWLLRWSQQARAVRLALAIVALRIAALMAEQMRMVVTPVVIDALTVGVIVAFLLLFQSDVRHAITRLDLVSLWSRSSTMHSFGDISTAIFSLAAARRGALMVVARHDAVEELVSGGVPLGGLVSVEILEAIFRKTSPVHNGAAIIVGRQVTKVGVVLPLTCRTDVPNAYGTRHRAAMGLAEQSDAIVLVASEERGDVTLMQGSRVERMGTAQDLESELTWLIADSPRPRAGWRHLLVQNISLKLTAVGLSALVWTTVFVLGATTVRVRMVPVVFTGVPPDMTISRQSAVAVETELVGKPWQLDSADLDDLVASIDVHASRPGRFAFALGPSVFRLPGGIRVQSVAPQRVTIDLERATE